MNQEEQEKQSLDRYPTELVEAIRQTTFTTLAVASVRGFTDLKITAIRKLADDLYAVRFTYYMLNRVEKATGWTTEKTFTEGRGLYVHEFAPALYLDAYAISKFVQDLVDPPSQD